MAWKGGRRAQPAGSSAEAPNTSQSRTDAIPHRNRAPRLACRKGTACRPSNSRPRSATRASRTRSMYGRLLSAASAATCGALLGVAEAEVTPAPVLCCIRQQVAGWVPATPARNPTGVLCTTQPVCHPAVAAARAASLPAKADPIPPHLCCHGHVVRLLGAPQVLNEAQREGAVAHSAEREQVVAERGFAWCGCRGMRLREYARRALRGSPARQSNGQAKMRQQGSVAADVTPHPRPRPAPGSWGCRCAPEARQRGAL